MAAIRRDTPRPTVHARNLFHVSAAMYDAWATYDLDAVGYFHVESAPGRSNRLKQEAAISYAAYRVLSHRFAESPGHATSQQQFDDLMRRLRHNPRNTNTRGYSPAAVGNRVARAIIEYGSSDGANEANGYVDLIGYQAGQRSVARGGTPASSAPRHQPLAATDRPRRGWPPTVSDTSLG